MFVRAKQGDAYLQAVLDRYDRMIASKRERREFGRLVREALVCLHTTLPTHRSKLNDDLCYQQDEQARQHTHTIFKGSFIRPTLYNKLLPRLVPQPVGTSCMIHKRRLGRERRYAQSVQLTEWIKDLEMECAFERQLRRAGERIQPVFSDDPQAWRTCFQHAYISLYAHAAQYNPCATSCGSSRAPTSASMIGYIRTTRLGCSCGASKRADARFGTRRGSMRVSV